MPLRIAVWHDPPSGGAQRSLSEMLSRLQQRGHEVHIFRLGVAHQDATSEQAYGMHTEVIPFALTPHRGRAFYWNDVQTWRDWVREEALERELASRIDSGSFDVAFVSVLRWGVAPSLLRMLNVPTIYYCHEPPRRFYEAWCRPQAAPLTAFERARLLWRWPSQRLLDGRAQHHDMLNVRAATTVLTNSRYTQGRIRQVYGREAEVCYLGVNAEAFSPARQASPRGVVSVGALEAHKGFDFLIEAVGRIPAAQRPPFTVVGSHGHPNMPGHLQQLAVRHGVDLTIARGLSDAELAALYRSSAAFVWGARMEPFGLVLLEAMASGLPVVAVAEGGVPEMVQHGITGYLAPRDPSVFAGHLQQVLADPALAQRMGAAGRSAAVERWRWDATVDVLEQHLHNAAQTAGRRVKAAS